MHKIKTFALYIFMISVSFCLLSSTNAVSKHIVSGNCSKKIKCPKSKVISEVWLDVTRIDFCSGRRCVTVGSGQNLNLMELANGSIEMLNDALVLPDHAGFFPKSLKLTVGSDNYAVADGKRYKLYIPGGQRFGIKLKGFHVTEPGILSKLLFDFDPDRYIKIFRKWAFLMRRNFRVQEAETVPFEGIFELARPGKGTTFSIADRFQLYVPPGAVKTPTALWIMETDSSLLTPVYTVGPGGTELSAPAEVKIHYRPEMLPPDYPEDSLVILHDGVPVTTQVMSDELLLGAEIYHLSTLRGSPMTRTTKEIIPGVEHIDRTMENIKVHVVLVDRDLTNYEWRILADERTSGDDVNLQTVKHLATTNNPPAIVAINGYFWDGDDGNKPGQTGNFASTTIINGVTKHTDPAPAESIIGFGQQRGFGTNVQRMTKDEYNEGSYGAYRHNLFGSHTSIMINGEPKGQGITDYWSAIGYSDSQVVLISSRIDWLGDRVNDEKLCNIFEDYGVTDAIRLDGGASTALVIDGKHINPISFTAIKPWIKAGFRSARHVAYAIGLVPVESEAPLETLSIPSDGTVIVSQRSYPTSSDYWIVASGTYIWGGCDPVNCPNGGDCGYIRYGDANWITDDCWDSHYDLFYGYYISLYMDGENVNWGDYSENHIYAITRQGNDGPFSFRINDGPDWYPDNSGSLTVRIYPAD